LKARALTTVAALLSLGCAHVPATGDVAGTYLHAWDTDGHPIALGAASRIDLRALPENDCLRVERRSEDEIFFDVVVNEPSGHSCSAEGTARRQGSGGEFEARLVLIEEWDPCIVRLRFTPSEIHVEGVNFECRHWCGAGAILEARFTPDARLSRSLDCEASPVPDLEELERAAERGLRELEEDR
jgi:hypothetical protein